MAWLARMKIKERLLLLLAMALTMLVALGGFAACTVAQEAQRATTFIDTEFESVRVLSEVREAMAQARNYEKDILLSMGDETATERNTALWMHEVKAVRASVAVAQDLATPMEQQQLNRLIADFNGYAQGFERLLRQMARGELNDPWAANTAMAPLRVQLKDANDAFNAVSVSIADRVSGRRQSLAATAADAPWVVVLATAAAAVLATLMVQAIVRSILRPISELQRTADAWGKGDLSQSVDDPGPCEIAEVKRDLGRMHQSLSALVARVHDGVDAVTTTTAGIAHANGLLADRTDSAAGALQRIAGAIDELTAAAQSTDTSADLAVSAAQTAEAVARAGGTEVDKLLLTMRDIEKASNRIGEIIGVIDHIAYQTNILALNAAVEAARVGEHGRGFAVVATEVRALAQRSAESARAITSIVEQAVGTVSRGCAVAASAGAAMQLATDSVGQVSQAMRDIRQATATQLQGIEGIRHAMRRIEATTQENASMVQRSADDADHLAQQTRHLHAAVAVFQLDRQHPERPWIGQATTAWIN